MPPAAGPGSRHASAIDWKSWSRAVERRRRALERARSTDGSAVGGLPRTYLARVTRASFRLDGIELSEQDVMTAVASGVAGRGSVGPGFRSRQGQRLRNHVAILRRIQQLVRRGQALSAATVVRWYTSISCGLTSACLDGGSLARLERVVRQINCPHLHLRPAVEEIARLHWDLLADPIMPSFNGILARLVLACHLGRCGMPPVLFDPARDGPPPVDAGAVLRRLLELVQQSYDRLSDRA